MPRKALGKGLDALIPGAGDEAASAARSQDFSPKRNRAVACGLAGNVMLAVVPASHIPPKHARPFCLPGVGRSPPIALVSSSPKRLSSTKHGGPTLRPQSNTEIEPTEMEATDGTAHERYGNARPARRRRVSRLRTRRRRAWYRGEVPAARRMPVRCVRAQGSGNLRVQEHGLHGARPGLVGTTLLPRVSAVFPSLLAVRASAGAPRPVQTQARDLHVPLRGIRAAHAHRQQRRRRCPTAGYLGRNR